MRRLTNPNIALSLSISLVVAGTANAVPNPAAWYCVQLGYEYQVREDAQGNEYGFCVFPDGSECNAWDYFRKCYYGEGSADCEWPCQELACREAGESVYLSECCEGLHKIRPAHIFDADCSELELVGWLFLCSDCGNGICECWESKCNCPADCAKPRIIYVDADAPGTNGGSSWADAYNYLQDALADANSVEKPAEIRVAQGIYKPDQGAGITPGNRVATFQLINDVAIRGGYAGFGEADPNARDIAKYKTILSGDVSGNDHPISLKDFLRCFSGFDVPLKTGCDEFDSSGDNDVDIRDLMALLKTNNYDDNSYHVVTGSGTDATGVLEGFTITAGNANEPGPSQHCLGAGMYNDSGSPVVRNCMFTGNFARSCGGGMYNLESDVGLSNCTFSGNSAKDEGGGVYNSNSDPIVINCTFGYNLASGAGGMWNISSRPRLTNCMFAGNLAYYYAGGGMLNVHSNAILTNCHFTGNLSGNYAGGMYNNGSNPALVNCIFTANSAKRSAGGIQNSYGEPLLINCTFSRNSAGRYGGAMRNDESKAKIVNCALTGNCAEYRGGAMENMGGESVLANCTITGNRADQGGGVCCSTGHTIIANSILSDNTPDEIYAWSCPPLPGSAGFRATRLTVSYSRPGAMSVQGDPVWGDPTIVLAGGNIDVAPCFVEPGYRDPNGTTEDPNDDFWVDGDYHLKSQAGRWDSVSESWVKDDVTSPCIDAGDMISPIGFEPFPNGGIINMGAYGGTAKASKSYFGSPICETIVAGDINGDCTVNFRDFTLMSFHWLEDNTLLPPPPPRR